MVSETADQILVMYGGRAVEHGPRKSVFHHPRHPYTWGLLDSVPRVTGPRLRRLPTIGGTPGASTGGGCAFADRCAYRHEACAEPPPLTGTDHRDACWLPAEQRTAEMRIR